MVKGALEMGVRFSSLASSWSSVFIVGAGAPGGVRFPCASKEDGRLAISAAAILNGNFMVPIVGC